MKFCNSCGYHLTSVTNNDRFIFRCNNCHREYPSTSTDTLMSEINYEASETIARYEVFQSKAATDPAGKKVDIECAKCHHPYMTQIYIGKDYKSRYICVCGYTTDTV